METCRMCHFPAELDDVAVGDIAGRFICLRCFHAVAESAKPLPKQLRRMIEEALAGVEEAA
jgi:hypothetical protein